MYEDHMEALRQAEQRIERLSYINSGLVDDFNTLLIAQSNAQRDALAGAVQRVEALFDEISYGVTLSEVIAAIKGTES